MKSGWFDHLPPFLASKTCSVSSVVQRCLRLVAAEENDPKEQIAAYSDCGVENERDDCRDP